MESAAQSVIARRSLEECLGQIDRCVRFQREFMGTTDGIENSMHPALAEALSAAVGMLDELRIPYAVVGGIAAMVYGRARFTEDVDFVLVEDHEQVLAGHPEVMKRFGFDPGCTWKLYHTSGVEMDIWKDAHSGEIARRAVPVEFRGKAVRIAEVHDLVAMKLRANRPQDDYDISEILKGNAIDESRVAGLALPAEWTRFLQIKRRISS